LRPGQHHFAWSEQRGHGIEPAVEAGHNSAEREFGDEPGVDEFSLALRQDLRPDLIFENLAQVAHLIRQPRFAHRLRFQPADLLYERREDLALEYRPGLAAVDLIEGHGALQILDRRDRLRQKLARGGFVFSTLAGAPEEEGADEQRHAD